MNHGLLFSLAAAGLAACGASSTDAPEPVDASPQAPDAADAQDAADASASTSADADVDVGDAPLVGAFQVQLLPALEGSATAPARAAQTTFFGRVQDAPSPELIVWRETRVEAGCRLLEPVVPFCSTPCGGSAACVADEVCAPYPTKLDAGELTVEGLRTQAGETRWTARAVAGNYQRSDLAYPPFEDGDAVRLRAPGAAGPGFELRVEGIAPLELTSPPIALEPNAPATLTWTPGPAGSTSEISVRLDISHHGGTRGKIECRAPDTGTLPLPSALTDALVALGTAGYPTVIVAREARGAVRVPAGRVDLVLSSTIEQSVLVPGVVSCVDDAACAAPERCGDDLQCH